jgi:flagellar protein FlbD
VIKVTRLDGTQYYLNAEMIQVVESTPDTVITMLNDVKVLVRERADQVVAEMIEYQRKVRQPYQADKETSS